MGDNKPAATAALAQTQEQPQEPGSEWDEDAEVSHAHHAGGRARRFHIADRATRAHANRPYERQAGEPVYRPLRIFTLDPSCSRLEGATAVLKVPYERLRQGPVGSMFEVDNFDGVQANQRVDLDDPLLVMNDGLDATPSDPRFHQQMVYAVASSVYATFRTALGRHVTWPFDRDGLNSEARLKLRPHLRGVANAYYDPQAGEISFGYFRAPPRVRGRNLPGSWVFTCLSHDIIAHEVTHALLDGLRAHFTLPTNPDVLAFHEALADLVAIFQHFTYRQVLETAITSSRGNLQLAPLLTELARQFSQTREGSHHGDALRSAVDDLGAPEGRRAKYGETDSPHELGAVLVAAIFDAFSVVYARKTRRYIQLATGGSGILPQGDLSPHLIAVLAEEAAALASQFLSICIRAVDYCPPVDLMFGEYLRALITADHALVPDDPWGYREALIDAFRVRDIFPIGVPNLSEDSLLWRAPEDTLPACEKLSFSHLKFRGDPSAPAGTEELTRQARVLGDFITSGRRAWMFGLADPGLLPDHRGEVALPTIESIRTTRRVGPSGQVVFDLVAEVTQWRTARLSNGAEFRVYGGATVVVDPEGSIRYIIAKSVASEEREQRQREFMESVPGQRLWRLRAHGMAPVEGLFRMAHKVEPPTDDVTWAPSQHASRVMDVPLRQGRQ